MKNTRKVIIALLLCGFALSGVVVAKHGADDKPGYKRGGGDDPKPHAMVVPQPSTMLFMARHGADDRPGDDHGGRHRGGHRGGRGGRDDGPKHG